MKRRRGSALLIVALATFMAAVLTGMVRLASMLYISSQDSSKIYANIQSYRAVAELSCYRYVTELEASIASKNLDAEWISVEGNALYTQALDALQAEIGSESDPAVWGVRDVTQILGGANLSNPAILPDLLAKFVGVDYELQLSVPEPLRFDWSDPDSYRSRDSAYIALEPFVVEVDLRVKSENIFEKFIVDGLYLDVQLFKMGETKHMTFQLTEKEEGVRISREAFR